MHLVPLLGPPKSVALGWLTGSQFRGPHVIIQCSPRSRPHSKSLHAVFVLDMGSESIDYRSLFALGPCGALPAGSLKIGGPRSGFHSARDEQNYCLFCV